MRAKSIMVVGTMSSAGKSVVTAGLCRMFHQDGYRVAPFKSQNMALNSYITKDGLEMGRAQVMQAEAAGIVPDIRMNPILLKPTSEAGSQVIVNGKVYDNLRAKEYYQRKQELIPEIRTAYESLAEEYDIIVLEGAGSPAEINLCGYCQYGHGCHFGFARDCRGRYRPRRCVCLTLWDDCPAATGGTPPDSGHHH